MADQRESRLLSLAAVFLFLYAVILSLSPSVREHSWSAPYRLSHWIGVLLWSAAIFVAFRITSRRLPDRDPYLLPLAALLGGWGLLTIWRLEPGLGQRQVLWLGVSVAALITILHAPHDLDFLRRYKYVLLGGGLLLTALTLLLGTNPAGAEPRLWLGCCGFYFQPSEPLKLLLVVYLAAYLADRPPVRPGIFPLFVPTIFVTGLALLLLIVQRDLGTASIFILLYTAILYLATDKRRVLLVTAAALLLAGFIGFFFTDVIHARLEAWLNPWNDPSGGAYQIIQSLLAVANGGIFGRGPGLGSPSLVPVAHSDFIFSAIAEETGLVGTIGLLAVFGLFLSRALAAALRATNRFHRLLASGLAAYIGIQALVIIAGNLRMLPLTGITLPFVSYGGSSLLTSFVALALLLVISNHADQEPEALASPRPYFLLAALLGVGIVVAAVANSWWAFVRAPALLARTDNPRRSIADRYVPRGRLLDRNNQPIDVTQGTSGSFKRAYLYPALSPVVGYTHPRFGQAGLEASLDDYLRGLQANPGSVIWWDQLLYGMPPPGLDVRLSLDLDLQKQADSLLGNYKGAVVGLNAQTGEILVMASHPTYDSNNLDQLGVSLARDKDAPLVNRATQGMYPLGTAASPFYTTLESEEALSEGQVVALYQKLGFYDTPQLRIPTANAVQNADLRSLRVSPLQMAIAAAALSNGGLRPAPRLALAVDTPQQGWVILPALGQAAESFTPAAAEKAVLPLATRNGTYWAWTGSAQADREIYTWYLAGTLPNWRATPLSLAVLIEGDFPLAVQRVGQQLIQSAVQP